MALGYELGLGFAQGHEAALGSRLRDPLHALYVVPGAVQGIPVVLEVAQVPLSHHHGIHEPVLVIELHSDALQLLVSVLQLLSKLLNLLSELLSGNCEKFHFILIAQKLGSDPAELLFPLVDLTHVR